MVCSRVDGKAPGIWLVAKKAGTPESDQTALCSLPTSVCHQPSYPPSNSGGNLLMSWIDGFMIDGANVDGARMHH